MKTLVQVICRPGRSLRDQIARDSVLEKFDLKVAEKKRNARSNGWAKLLSSHAHGAINLMWDQNTDVLICWVVNRGKGKPDLIIGAFVCYLLSRHRKRIIALNVMPNRT